MALVLEIRTTSKKAAAEIKKLATKAGADVRTLEKQSVTSAGRMSKGFSRLSGTLGALGLGAGLVVVSQGFKKVIQDASDTEESLNKVIEVFGEASNSVIKFSEDAATSLGASKQEALAMTGEIGNLLVAMKFAEDDAGDFSTKMVQLAADLGSFNNVPTVDALNAIRSALVGESEPIRRFGADVRQTRLDSIALGLGLEFTKGKMDAQTKALAAMEAIMQDTKKAQGDFARTSDGLANSSKILTANLNDLSANIGTQLLPTVNKLVLSLNSLFAGDTEKSIKNFSKLLTDKVGASLLGLIAPVFSVVGGLATIREEAEKLKNIKFGFVGPQTEEQLEAVRLQKELLLQQVESEKVLKKESDIRKSILADIAAQEQKLRIINQLKAEGLIPLSEEEIKAKQILEHYKNAEPILLFTENKHAQIRNVLEDDVFFTNMIADATARWKREAEEAKQKLFEAAGILNEIVLLAAGARKFSISGILGLGASIAGLIPGGQGVAAILGAGSIATRGFQGGGSFTVPGTGSGDRPFRVNLEPGERVDITPRNQVINNNSGKIEIKIFPQMFDERFVRNDFVPLLKRLDLTDNLGLGLA